MTKISFTDNLSKHLPVPPVQAGGATVREVLETVFNENPQLKSYLLDDQCRLRKHVNVFINGSMVADRTTLSDPVGEHDEVFVFQALSGG